MLPPLYIPMRNMPPNHLGDHETWMMAAVSVLTNLTGVPIIARMLVQARMGHAVILVWTMITSMLYHLGDALYVAPLGMTPGSWHRLDNIFAIASFQVLFATLLFPDSLSPSSRDVLSWGLFAWTIVCQEAGPWDLKFTIIPLLTSALVSLAVFLFTPPHSRPTFAATEVKVGLAIVAVAAFFFSRGLDEDNDWIRLNHGLWHFFIALAFYTLASARQPQRPSTPPTHHI